MGAHNAKKDHECSLSSLQCKFAARTLGTCASEWTILPYCGAFLSDYAWNELATVLLAVHQLSDHYRAGVGGGVLGRHSSIQ